MPSADLDPRCLMSNVIPSTVDLKGPMNPPMEKDTLVNVATHKIMADNPSATLSGLALFNLLEPTGLWKTVGPTKAPEDNPDSATHDVLLSPSAIDV